MKYEIAKLIIQYLSVSLLSLLLYTYGPIDLQTPKAWRKYKDLLIVLFSIFWPCQITIFINTIRIMKGRDKK